MLPGIISWSTKPFKKEGISFVKFQKPVLYVEYNSSRRQSTLTHAGETCVFQGKFEQDLESKILLTG